MVSEKDAQLKERTKALYDGEVVVGEDLMAFDIRKDEIKVIPPSEVKQPELQISND